MKKYTLILASVTLISLVSTVTATDYESNVFFEDSGYGYDYYGSASEPTNCALQFASFDGSVSCISGKPSGWHRPKSDYWHHEASYVVVESTEG